MNIDEIRAIEAQMLIELKDQIASNRYALDAINPSIRSRISNILGYGPISTEGWFISACSILDGQRPIDVLKIDESRVVEAALYKKANSTWHG